MTPGRHGQYLVVREGADGEVRHFGPMYAAPGDKIAEAERLYRRSPEDRITVVPWSAATRKQKEKAATDSVERRDPGNGC